METQSQQVRRPYEAPAVTARTAVASSLIGVASGGPSDPLECLAVQRPPKP
ncbi:MAG: hypothetical protein WCI50_04730 [Actinomycetes bacterium]